MNPPAQDSVKDSAPSPLPQKDNQKNSQKDAGEQMNGKKEGREFKLRGFYYLAELSAEIAALILGILMYHFRTYFPWIPYPVFNFWLFIIAMTLHALCFAFREITRKQIFFVLARYIFLIFFFLLIYTTGGVESPLFFVLMFPLLVSTADLDERSTRRIGVVVIAFMVAMLIINPLTVSDASFVVLHSLQIILYALIAAFLYSIVKETLRQKYEKEEANRKLLKVVEFDRLKTVFVTIAQHQLRTPLSGVRWALDNVLKEGKVPDETSSLLQESYNKVDESIKIVDEMLKTAESDIENFHRNVKTQLDISALLATIVQKLTFLTKKNNVHLDFVVVQPKHEGEKPFIISGAKETLEPALTNIIDNSIRYSPNGTVRVSIASEKTQIKIQVSDNGIGIDSVDQGNIFERFYRGKNAIAIDPNESGIGLYSAKNIIELYGGTINFTSVLGKGTTFTVTFPK